MFTSNNNDYLNNEDTSLLYFNFSLSCTSLVNFPKQARHAVKQNGAVVALSVIGRWLSEYRKANQAIPVAGAGR
jgi:hypothetical protein